MNYFYDVILNWSENSGYEFYEWNDNDPLELIKKIPIFKIKHKVFLDIIENNVKVTSEFLKSILDKTMISGKNLVNKIPYAALFTDNKSVIALEFDEKGISTNRSKLMIDDELNIIEISYALKDVNLEYEIISKINNNNTLRQINDAKHLIHLELDNLYQNKDLDKLKYLYFELKKEKVNDINIIYKTLLNEVENNFNSDVLKLYYIIKLSYHNV